MKKTTTVIFDLDGTLLDTLQDLSDSINYILGKHGYPQRSEADVRQFIGNGMYRLTQLSLPEGLPEDKVKCIYHELKTYYTAHCNVKTKLYPGIADLLNYLKKMSYKLAIVSNKNNDAVLELKELYFKQFIEVAIGQQEGIRRKPYADTVLRALVELRSDTSEAVYIGDSEVDIKTAQNARVNCIAVSWGFRDIENLKKAGAQIIANTAEDIISFLAKY